MKLEKAIEIIEQHNKWRRGNSAEIEMVDVFELGESIDIIVSAYKNKSTKSYTETQMDYAYDKGFKDAMIKYRTTL